MATVLNYINRAIVCVNFPLSVCRGRRYTVDSDDEPDNPGNLPQPDRKQFSNTASKPQKQPPAKTAVSLFAAVFGVGDKTGFEIVIVSPDFAATVSTGVFIPLQAAGNRLPKKRTERNLMTLLYCVVFIILINTKTKPS